MKEYWYVLNLQSPSLCPFVLNTRFHQLTVTIFMQEELCGLVMLIKFIDVAVTLNLI